MRTFKYDIVVSTDSTADVNLQQWLEKLSSLSHLHIHSVAVKNILATKVKNYTIISTPQGLTDKGCSYHIRNVAGDYILGLVMNIFSEVIKITDLDFENGIAKVKLDRFGDDIKSFEVSETYSEDKTVKIKEPFYTVEMILKTESKDPRYLVKATLDSLPLTLYKEFNRDRYTSPVSKYTLTDDLNNIVQGIMAREEIDMLKYISTNVDVLPDHIRIIKAALECNVITNNQLIDYFSINSLIR